MAGRQRGKRAGVFISHAGVNLAVAEQVEAALDAAGYDPWLDRSDIRVGALLGKELRQAIEASRAVVLVWSKAAARSPWVAAAEFFVASAIRCAARGRRQLSRSPARSGDDPTAHAPRPDQV